jgi:hydroxymethylpyrimidine/phosphomethylpyrimidine kinase
VNPHVVLTIAGTDSGGGAGIAADLATFAALGAHGAAVVTAVTAQDTTGVHATHAVPRDIVKAQLDAVLDDLPVESVKTGMLASPEVVRHVAGRITEMRHDKASPVGGRVALVVDPVLVATTGGVLGGPDVARAYVDHLFPVATVITPNRDEARTLLGIDASAQELAAKLTGFGTAVVLTGGGSSGTCTDWVAIQGTDPVPLTHPAVSTNNDHGTGCTFSSALAVYLARGVPLAPAVRRAAAYTTHQLRAARYWTLGRGRGPIAHTHIHPGSEEK